MENRTLESILNEYLSGKDLEFVQHLLLGPNKPKKIDIHPTSENARKIEIKSFNFCANSSHSVRVGIFQNSIVQKTTAPIVKQREALLKLGEHAINLAAELGVKIFCFQELWNMPMGTCTLQKLPWVEFAENAHDGPTTIRLQALAKKYKMVIISPILERDAVEDCLWNSAVVIDNYGFVLGVSRKNHIPISGRYSESYYYNPSEIGHPVFKTDYGKIAVSICYERHHPQCFLAYGINEAQIVFNPSATIQSFSESLWAIEARDAAVKNKFYVCAINRVGVEEYYDGDGSKSKTKAGPFFGSSYICAPDGSRTPGLSVDKNGLLVADLDLNSCNNETAEEKIRGFDKCLDNYLKSIKNLQM